MATEGQSQSLRLGARPSIGVGRVASAVGQLRGAPTRRCPSASSRRRNGQMAARRRKEGRVGVAAADRVARRRRCAAASTPPCFLSAARKTHARGPREDSDGLLAARGENPAAFDRRCIPPWAALGVVHDGPNTPGILPLRAVPRATAAWIQRGVGATQDSHHGLWPRPCAIVFNDVPAARPLRRP